MTRDSLSFLFLPGRALTAARPALILLAVSFSGCLCPERTGMIGVEAAWKVIAPEYRAYLTADPQLSPDSKADRLKTAEILDRLLEEAKKARWK